VKKDSPIQTFQQFVDECKKRRVVVATIGRSGSSHIQLAALQKELNLPFGMVHFEGSGKAYPAVMGGHVDAAISGPGSGSRMRDSLHFLGVTGEEREKALPDVATLKEQGFAVTPIDQIWYAMATPKVPEERLAILSNAFAKAFEDKLLWEQMQKVGEYLKLLTRPQVDAMVRKQAEVIERYKELLG
jgi:putative tricarboxylic transport membrane protein